MKLMAGSARVPSPQNMTAAAARPAISETSNCVGCDLTRLSCNVFLCGYSQQVDTYKILKQSIIYGNVSLAASIQLA
jgi:hypothetical protein